MRQLVGTVLNGAGDFALNRGSVPKEYTPVYDGEQARFLQAFVEEYGLAEVALEHVGVGTG